MNAEARLIQQESRAQIHGEVPVSLWKPAGMGGFLISGKILNVSLVLRNWGPLKRWRVQVQQGQIPCLRVDDALMVYQDPVISLDRGRGT